MSSSYLVSDLSGTLWVDDSMNYLSIQTQKSYNLQMISLPCSFVGLYLENLQSTFVSMPQHCHSQHSNPSELDEIFESQCLGHQGSRSWRNRFQSSVRLWYASIHSKQMTRPLMVHPQMMMDRPSCQCFLQLCCFVSSEPWLYLRCQIWTLQVLTIVSYQLFLFLLSFLSYEPDCLLSNPRLFCSIFVIELNYPSPRCWSCFVLWRRLHSLDLICRCHQLWMLSPLLWSLKHLFLAASEVEVLMMQHLSFML